MVRGSITQKSKDYGDLKMKKIACKNCKYFFKHNNQLRCTVIDEYPYVDVTIAYKNCRNCQNFEVK